MQETGVTIVTKGRYFNTKNGELPGQGDDRPLYLHVTADSQQALSQAVMRIENLMNAAPSVCTTFYSFTI